MKRILLVILVSLLAAAAQAQSVADFAVTLGNDYAITPNLVYSRANNVDNKLDVYKPRTGDGPFPTLIYIHGGGWVGGMKEQALFSILPYLQMGFAVVNVEYRLGAVSPAPAAVEDCRCALRWVIRNAKQYGFDPNKLVVTGHSAGGHLSLTTGMLSPSFGFDRYCFSGGDEVLKVAAIVNWFGITDVQDLLEGPNQKTYAVQWLGGLLSREDVARRVSPLWMVRGDLPPILTIHGDADPTVPYTHAQRLHKALDKAGVANQLVTVPGGKHGGFTKEEMLKIFGEIRAFLQKNRISQP